MPKRPGTTARTVRIGDELWQASQAKAAERGTNVSAEIVRFLERWSSGDAAAQAVTLPVGLVARAVLALDRDVTNRPSVDELCPGVPHDCEPEDSDESCVLLHDQWLTRFGPHPVATALREALAVAAS